jgi:hypothetical protein
MDIKALIKKLLNGTGDAPATAKIAKLRAIQTAALANLAELKKQRAQAYLDDIDDQAILGIEKEIERLEAAQIADREREERAALTVYLEASADMANKLESVDVSAFMQRQSLDKYAHIIARYTEPLAFAGILGGGHGVTTAIDIRRRIAAAWAAFEGRYHPQARPEPKKLAPVQNIGPRPLLPNERARITDSQREVSGGLGNRAMPRQGARQPDDWGPLQPGEARAKVQSPHGGYCASDTAMPSHFGHVLRMNHATAKIAANNGAVEIIEVYGGPPAAAPTASTEIAGANWESVPRGVQSVTALGAGNVKIGGPNV